MKIAIEQGVYLGGMRGVGAYVKHLAQALSEIDSQDRFILFGFFFRDFQSKLSQIHCPKAANFELAIQRWPESLITRLEWRWGVPAIDFFCRRRGVDVYHSPGMRMPRLSRAAGVMTVHDLLPEIHPELFPSGYPGQWSAFAREQVKRADLIMADSERTKQDLLERFKTPESKIRVVYLGIDHKAFAPLKDAEAAAGLRKKFGLRDRYLLSVGPWEKRRNLETELQALRILVSKPETADCGLVLAGAAESPYAASLQRLATDMGLAERVAWTGYVSQAELAGLYTLAGAYVYPSWYDGYNMPMLEAMSCGCPVLCSTAGVLPELGQDACLYFDPGNAEAMADAMRRALTDRSLADELRRKGLRRTNDFQWQKTARECLQAYREAAS